MSEIAEVKADIRQIRDTLVTVQVGLGRFADIGGRLEKIEANQVSQASQIAEVIASSRSHAKLVERFLPWIVAILCSGGLISGQVLGGGSVASVPTIPPFEQPIITE